MTPFEKGFIKRAHLGDDIGGKAPKKPDNMLNRLMKDPVIGSPMKGLAPPRGTK